MQLLVPRVPECIPNLHAILVLSDGHHGPWIAWLQAHEPFLLFCTVHAIFYGFESLSDPLLLCIESAAVLLLLRSLMCLYISDKAVLVPDVLRPALRLVLV